MRFCYQIKYYDKVFLYCRDRVEKFNIVFIFAMISCSDYQNLRNIFDFSIILRDDVLRLKFDIKFFTTRIDVFGKLFI